MHLDLKNVDYIWSSFSGADIIVAIKLPMGLPFVLGTLSDVTLATNRPAFEVLRFSNTCAVGFTNGPRVVAGQLIFNMFDHHLLQELSAEMLRRVKDTTQSAYSKKLTETTRAEQSGVENYYQQYDPQFDIQEYENSIISMYDDHEDELPLFDIIINFCNENSYPAHAIIRGVKLVDSNWGFGINHPESKIVYSYVAINFKPITRGFYQLGYGSNSMENNTKTKDVVNLSYDPINSARGLNQSMYSGSNRGNAGGVAKSIMPVWVSYPYAEGNAIRPLNAWGKGAPYYVYSKEHPTANPNVDYDWTNYYQSHNPTAPY